MNGLVTGGNEQLLSKSLVQAIEVHWRALAADLLVQGTATSLAEVEVVARRQVELCLFDTLRGNSEIGSADLPLAQAVHTERPPIDVLEAVHEYLLSRQLHQSPDGKLECRSSRRHRRSQGIYYTPDYIAEYLTGRCLSGWSLACPPRVLDPACGCGRFLLAAARQLLRQDHPAVEIARSLHGYDLDEEAVQVARRMLLLTLTPHVAAPNDVNAITVTLDENIICGNSLTNSLWEKSSLPSEARGRDREGDEAPDNSSPPPMSTSSNLQPPASSLTSSNLQPPASSLTSSNLQSPVSSLTSFDIILGNPPYRRELGTKGLLDQIAQTEFGRRYRAPRMDLWYYFLHRGIELLAPDGRLGFIVGAYWAAGAGANRLIATLRETVHIEEIFQLDRLQVFRGVAGHHMMLVLSKPPSSKPTTVRLPVFTDVTDARSCVEGRGEVHTFTKTPGQLFRQGLLDLEPPAEQLLEHLSHFPTLSQLGKIRQGIAENPASVTKAANRKHGELWQIGKGVFALTPNELASLDLPSSEQPLIRLYHGLCDLGRYDRADDPSLRLIYSTRQTWAQLDDFPILAAHLTPFRPIMEARRETRQEIRTWWQLHWPREELIWEQPKLLALQMAQRPTFVPAQTPTYVSFSVNVFLPAPGIREHLNYFAALLNSRLLWKWFRHHAKRRGVGLEINGHVLARAPIRQIDFDSPQDTNAHDRLVSLVNRMLELSRRRRVEPHPEIDAERHEIDLQIDRLVYKLYDLDEDDIAAIEAACRES